MQRGTLLFTTSEQLPRKRYIKQEKQEDLKKVDIWQLGITLFSLINPGLNAPFDIEFERMRNIPEVTFLPFTNRLHYIMSFNTE